MEAVSKLGNFKIKRNEDNIIDITKEIKEDIEKIVNYNCQRNIINFK